MKRQKHEAKTRKWKGKDVKEHIRANKLKIKCTTNLEVPQKLQTSGTLVYNSAKTPAKPTNKRQKGKRNLPTFVENQPKQ